MIKILFDVKFRILKFVQKIVLEDSTPNTKRKRNLSWVQSENAKDRGKIEREKERNGMIAWRVWLVNSDESVLEAQRIRLTGRPLQMGKVGK